MRPVMIDRRRRRRRQRGPLALSALAAGLAVLLVAGGILHISSGSGPYRRTVDRSFAAGVAVLAQQSNDTGAVLTRLVRTVAGGGSLSRTQLQLDLDTLADQTAQQSAAAQLLTPPDPVPSGAAEAAAAAFSLRAGAMATVRSALDGLFTMVPLPVAGAAGPSGTVATPPAPLTAAQTTADLVRAGAALESADGRYAALVRSMARAPGNARLPESVWVRHHDTWNSAQVTQLVSDLATAPQLEARHDLQVVTVGIQPVAVPPSGSSGASSGGGPGSVSVIPPTPTITVTVVVADGGNVIERGVPVVLRLTPDGAGRGAAAAWKVTLLPGGARALVSPPLPVRAGRTYQLSSTIESAAAQARPADLRRSFAITVAAATPKLPPSI